MEEGLSHDKKRGYAQFLEHETAITNPSTESSATSPTLDSLCTRCQAIDLQAVFQKKVRLDLGSFVLDLGQSVQELRDSGCVLCQLFGSMSPSDFDEGGSARSERCHLRAFSANRVFARLKTHEMLDTRDTTLLGVVRVNISDANSGQRDAYESLQGCLQETGYLCSAQADQSQSILGVRLRSPELFDIEFVTNCLAYCQANHRQVCSTAMGSPIESLRVIDCQSRIIVTAPTECHYAALSYVWGQSKSPISTSTTPQCAQSTLQNCPKVINDSIDVTLKLHLRYLWVDRYCIDQLNEDDKHNQIRQMDLIYAHARLTIIGAAGQDPDHGLPGIRGTVRNRQPNLKIGNHFLVSTLPHPKWSVGKSKWATRGWTYQEGLLTKRRIVFTDEQVVYECNGMHCAEALIKPLDKLHVKSKKTFKEDTPRGAFYHKTPGKKPWEIMAYISEFNKRHLTFPEDAVNAMQGIFNSFSNSPRPLYQFLGVPILPPDAALNNGTSYKPTHRSAEECFIVGLSWSHFLPGERRPYFPSWSWAGWLGELDSTLNVDEDLLIRFKDVNVWVEQADGTPVRFPSWENLPSFLSQPHRKTKFIHVEATTLPLSVCYLRKEAILSNCNQQSKSFLERYDIKEDGYYAKLQTEEDKYIYWRIQMDRKVKDVEAASSELAEKAWTDCIGIFLCPWTPDRRWSEFQVLLVEEMDMYAERVGYLCIGAHNRLQYQGGVWDRAWLLNEKFVSDLPWVRRKIRLG